VRKTGSIGPSVAFGASPTCRDFRWLVAIKMQIGTDADIVFRQKLPLADMRYLGVGLKRSMLASS